MVVLNNRILSLIALLATSCVPALGHAQANLLNGFPSWLTTIPIEQIDLEDLFGGKLPDGLFNPPATGTKPTPDSNFGANLPTPDSDDDIELIKPVILLPITPEAGPTVNNNNVFCGSWNSFITPAVHVLELSQFDNTTKTLAYHLYNQEGKLVGDGEQKIAPALEKDVVLNEFLDNLPQQIGTICISGAESTSGRISVYKQDATDHSTIEFVANWPLTAGKSGNQHVALNTFYPYQSTDQSDFVVSNWIELTNLGASEQSGTLTIYYQNGEIAQQSALTLAPRARLDIPGHSIGASAIGSARWVPNRSDAMFTLTAPRYYHNNATFEEIYAAATVVSSSNDKQSFIAHISLKDLNNEIIELSNASNATNKVAIKLTGADSTEIFSIELQPNASFHIATSALNATGESILINAEKPFTAQLQSYSYGDGLALQSVATLEKLAKSSNTLSTSYNTYLNSQCTLRIFNRTANDETVLVTMQRDSGKIMLGKNFQTFSETTLDGEPYFIAAAASLDIDICQHDEQDQLGLVSVFTDSGNSKLSALLIKNVSDSTSIDFLALTPSN